MKARSWLCLRLEKFPLSWTYPLRWESMRLPCLYAQAIHEDSGGVATISSSRPPMVDTHSIGREIIEILDDQTVCRPKTKPYYEYLVWWSARHGTSPPGSMTRTWEDSKTLSSCIVKPRCRGRSRNKRGECHILPSCCCILPHLSLYIVFIYELFGSVGTLFSRSTSHVDHSLYHSILGILAINIVIANEEKSPTPPFCAEACNLLDLVNSYFVVTNKSTLLH